MRIMVYCRHITGKFSFIKNNMSQRNILNNEGLSTDTWETPKSISSQGLQLELILILCFLFVK